MATVLAHVASQFHARVEPLVTLSGHRTEAENSLSGGHEASNHMSATAVDLNVFEHPCEQPRGFTAARVATIDQICAETSGTVYWGGYFGGGLKDGMYFEIKTGVTAAQVEAAASALGSPTPTPKDLVRHGRQKPT
ncbi:hypothetical protein JS562_52110 [Agrobacterium sp. S2]|nr:hypothetical protein [Agrobacterium sp. S2]